MEFLIYLVLGGFAGTLAGLFGVGGGMIIVPVLVYSFSLQGMNSDVLTHMAVGTSLATIVFTSINAIRAHHKKGAVCWHLFVWLTVGIVLGTVLGALTAAQISGAVLQKIIGVFAICVAIQMAFKLQPKASLGEPGKPVLGVAGGVIGWASAIFGIGGGSLTVPFLVWRSVPMQQAVATSSACGLPIAVAGALSFIVTGWHETALPSWSLGYVYLPALLGIAATSMLFAGFGARLAHRLSQDLLKRLFALLLLCVGINFLVQEQSMLTYPQIDPVALAIGPLKIHWYGLMYLIGIGGAWWLAKRRLADFDPTWSKETLSDLVFWVALGVIAGGRLGYVLFYDLQAYISNPLLILEIWKGGMSFHGGLLGVLLALLWFSRRHNKRFFELVDFVAPLVPIGLGAGRIGNFINAELWGKATDLPWAMVFPTDPAQLARHPSQLYQFALEGVALFTILWFYSRKPRPTMAVSGLFAICYGCFRFAVEFVRVPDEQLGYLAFDWLTMGQLLCIPMIVFGALLMGLAYRREGRTA